MNVLRSAFDAREGQCASVNYSVCGERQEDQEFQGSTDDSPGYMRPLHILVPHCIKTI